MKKAIVLLFILSLAMIIIGCGGGGGSSNPTHANITGSVTEFGTNIPLCGVTVELGNKATVTDTNGNYRFSIVSTGTHSLGATLDGYEPYNRNITINSNQTVDIQMTTNGPVVTNQNLVIQDPLGNLISDQMELEDNVSVLNISGNINNLAGERTQSGASIRAGITVEKLQALVNSVIYPITIEPDGSFNQDVPLNPGDNTIQLRVYDSNGNAGTGPVIRVKVTIKQIDIRVVLKWDTDESDVDLHMFKRTANEPTPPYEDTVWDSDDRHIYWGNSNPDDFGNGTKNNPFLDIDDTDGYGPETLLLQEASEGRYHIYAHYYDAPQDQNSNDIPSNITLTIILKAGTNEAVTHEIKQTLINNEQALYLCTIDWPSGEIIDELSVESGKAIGKSIKRITLKKTKQKPD